jgi:hypothetical protein
MAERGRVPIPSDVVLRLRPGPGVHVAAVLAKLLRVGHKYGLRLVSETSCARGDRIAIEEERSTGSTSGPAADASGGCQRGHSGAPRR